MTDTRTTVERLEQLKADIERLPRFVLHFGGGPVDGLPDSIVRYVVISMLTQVIEHERAAAPPSYVDLLMPPKATP